MNVDKIKVTGSGRKVVPGLILIGVAVCILLMLLNIDIPFLNRFMILGQLKGGEKVALILSLLVFIGGIFQGEVSALTFPLGIAYCIIDAPMHLPEVKFWPMMLITLIFTVGVSFLTPGSDIVAVTYTTKAKYNDGEEDDDE